MMPLAKARGLKPSGLFFGGAENRMFTWICPRCGRELSPSYAECPNCTTSRQAAATATAASIPPGAVSSATPLPASEPSFLDLVQEPPYDPPSPPPEPPPPPPVLLSALMKTEADTARNVGRIAALVVLVAFFLPWVGCHGIGGKQTISGLELANHGASALWTVPVVMLIALALLARGGGINEQITTAKTMIGAGLGSLAVMLYYYQKLFGQNDSDAIFRKTFIVIEFGAVLSFLGSLGLGITGFIGLRNIESARVASCSLQEEMQETDVR
jgi:hypothetical protein